ncbi:adenylylsulfate kinase [Gemmiger sp. An50]|nr:adenylylsulfate kinase [Gemmiger sp. An50]
MTLPAAIPHGDMPGDKVLITESHVAKAKTILPVLVDKMIAALENKPLQRCVLSVCGGSGVGKSETASLLGWYLGQLGAKSYILSGDNYPHRIPEYNDAERLRVFRDFGLKGLVACGLHTAEISAKLHELMEADKDADPALCGEYGWLSVYQAAGRRGLKGYLGTPGEIDFDRVNGIIAQFQAGAEHIALKRMGRRPSELWTETVDFSATSVLIIEWTHSNNDNLAGVDLPVLLNSTPAETMAHRRERNRDGKVDSPFTTMVLEIEQGLLASQAHKAAVILSKSGELLSYADYQALMANA